MKKIMKKIINSLIILSLITYQININTISAYAAETPLVFADSNLNNIFCDFVGKAHGSVVYKSEVDNKMQQVYSEDPQGYNVDLDIDGVTDLSGIEQLKDLTYPVRSLTLRSTVSSLNPIKDFKLSSLVLENATNDNLKVFNDSTVLQNSLQSLEFNPWGDVANEGLTNISPVSKLVNLKELHIFQTKITDISPLQNLNNLEILQLDGLNRWSLPKVDLGAVKSLPSLNTLILARLDIGKEYLKPFSEPNTFVKLKRLVIMNDNLKDISYLKNRDGISELVLSDCELDDKAYDTLVTMDGVRYLNINYNHMTTLEPIKSMPNMIELTADSNKIKSLKPLEGLPEKHKLRSLSVDENLITDIFPLTKASNLEHICISNNYIDIFDTQKGNLDKIKCDVISKPQYALVGKDKINMHVGDKNTYEHSNQCTIKNRADSTDILAEVRQTNDGKIFTRLEGHLVNPKYKFETDNKMDSIDSEFYISFNLKAIAPGESYLKTTINDTDSPYTTVNTIINIIGEAPAIKGSITVKYQDQNGADLETPTVNSNLDMGEYTYSPKSFSGYITDDVDKSVTLTEGNKDKTVIFKYRKVVIPPPVLVKGSITVKYLDENGTDLEDPTVNSNLDMGTYTYKPKSFKGYITIDEDKSVTLMESKKDQVIIFTYKTEPKLPKSQDTQTPVKPKDPKPAIKLPQTGSPINSSSLIALGSILCGAAFIMLKKGSNNNK